MPLKQVIIPGNSLTFFYFPWQLLIQNISFDIVRKQLKSCGIYAVEMNAWNWRYFRKCFSTLPLTKTDNTQKHLCMTFYSKELLISNISYAFDIFPLYILIWIFWIYEYSGNMNILDIWISSITRLNRGWNTRLGAGHADYRYALSVLVRLRNSIEG